ncbi:extradiol ring-cleavage dioxygenase [Raineyella sp. W15-4]|uniref:extradiol ring-cleavage dioxygenase n=1 Tax=Raineyella sp. W15-4 TaxID=3081651 RepID=UPI0029538EF9|nr:extradiol ring-cleavage dioxygenase [Raineyella sp. W15-4]WOQ17252.1 extradiol ring-cleavage dioxygenase [Raineyella sp. W15-4]
MTDTRFLGLGLTHYPLLAGKDEDMAGLLRYTLRDPDIPAELKDPASWPEPMRAEWSDDGGTAAAAGHRRALVRDLDRCREALDDFAPDYVVVWGDDQYENFREEVIPPFCVLAYPDVEVEAFAVLNSLGQTNVWGLPDDQQVTIKGDRDFSRALADSLIRSGVDMSYSYVKRKDAHFPHAILNTQLFLDYEHAGQRFPYTMVPITVNCYGAHVIARRGGLAHFAQIRQEQVDPSGPTPQRCFEHGAEVARVLRDTGKRIALVASSSWSHAFLHDKGWHLRPDTTSDRNLYDALAAGDLDTWLAVTSDEVVASGQQEILNWYCLLGAVHELGLRLEWSDFVSTDVFNSNKSFAIYREGTR